MKIQKLLSTLVLAASISVPMLMTNTALAGDSYYGKGHGKSAYKHGYRDGYRDSSYDEPHYRRRPPHDYYSGYSHDYSYRPHRAAGHGYRGYAPHGGIDLIFRF